MQNLEISPKAGFKFLEQARIELAAGDLPEASESGWAAAAQMVKAIAAQRDLPHTAHWHLQRVIDRLVAETGDDDIDTRFRAAYTLHINFYENTESAVSVAAGLQDVVRLLDKLRPILEAGDAP